MALMADPWVHGWQDTHHRCPRRHLNQSLQPNHCHHGRCLQIAWPGPHGPPLAQPPRPHRQPCHIALPALSGKELGVLLGSQ